MDAKTLESLGGKVRKITVLYARKVWAEGRGSVGTDLGIEVDVGSEADADALVNATYEYAREAVNRNMGDVMRKVVEAPASHPTVPGTAVTPVPAGSTLLVPAPPPASTAIQEVELSIVTLDAPTCAHLVQDGQHRFKIFGGKWAKFGVPVYEEVLKQYKIEGWETWAVCATTKGVPETGNRFQLPGGFQKVEVEVNEAGKPVRVHSFK